MERERVLGSVIIDCRSGAKMRVMSIDKEESIETLSLTFDSGRTFKALLAFSNAVIRFEDEALQKDVEQEIASLHEKKKEQEKLIEEKNAFALAYAKQRVEREAALKATRKKGGGKKDPTRRIDRKNLAFKATFCDGGEEWFRGPCSDATRERNCGYNGGKFCGTESVCKKALDGATLPSRVQEAFADGTLCYESRLLLEYKIYAGRDRDNTLRGWKLEKDRLVLLTAILPGELEKDRVIFGAFLVDKVRDKGIEEASATSYPEYRLSLTKEEAKSMRYWDYAPGEGKNHDLIQWKENLFRYQSDLVAAIALRDLAAIIEKRCDPVQSIRAKAFYRHYLDLIHKKEEDIPAKSGAAIKEE